MLILLSSCSGDDAGQNSNTVTTTTCDTDSGERTTAMFGDAASDPQITVLARQENGSTTDVGEGVTISLMEPPQGGRVMFIGVKAMNFGACGVRLEASLQDEATQQVQFDNRSFNLVPVEDGWGSSALADLSTFSNIPLCPNNWSDSNIYDNTFLLTVTLTDLQDRQVTFTAHVTPTCMPGAEQAQCQCFCKTGYVLGQSCS